MEYLKVGRLNREGGNFYGLKLEMIIIGEAEVNFEKNPRVQNYLIYFFNNFYFIPIRI